MLFLLLHVVFSCAFLQIARLGQVNRQSAAPAGAVNYAIAALFGLAYFLIRPPQGDAQAWSLAASLGAINGTLFATHLLIMLAAFSVAGVGITVAVTQSGTIIPVLVSWYFWQGPMTPMRWVAVGLVPVAMALMRASKGPMHHLNLKADTVLAASFALAGMIGVAHKAQVRYVEAMQPVYHLVLFTCAAVGSWSYVLTRRIPVIRGDVLVGVPWGLTNAANVVFLLLALAAIPATQVFPIASTATISGSLLLSRLFWGERISVRQSLGIACAIAVVGLVNM